MSLPTGPAVAAARPDASIPITLPPLISITTIGDEFGTFRYSFEWAGVTHECFDFPDHEEAVKGAEFHLQCLIRNLPHEVSDGIGAIYRPELAAGWPHVADRSY